MSNELSVCVFFFLPSTDLFNSFCPRMIIINYCNKSCCATHLHIRKSSNLMLCSLYICLSKAPKESTDKKKHRQNFKHQTNPDIRNAMEKRKAAKSTRSTQSRSASEIDIDKLPEHARMYLANFEKQFEREKAALESKYEEMFISMQRCHEIMKMSIDPAIGNSPFEELPQTSAGPTVRTRSSRRRSRSCSSFAVPKVVGPAPKRKKASSSDRKDRIRYQTPANQGIPQTKFITPKVNFNAPLAILRRPRQGELAVSMAGSPLLVSSITKEDSVNINIPLDDGSVVSILPQAGLQRGDFPSQFSHHTKQQLQTIHQNLNVILQND